MQTSTSLPEQAQVPPADQLVAYSQPIQQSRAPPRQPENALLPNILQQQGLLQQALGSQDPSTSAHVLHLLQQLNNGPSWQHPAQPASGSGLDTLLQQIARQPELAASLPSLLSTFTSGGQGFAGKSTDPNVGQAEGGPSTYTSQLYGAGNSGLADAELKDGSQDLGHGLDDDPKNSSVKCAKEKNRQAQRRFRERQKGLISALKDRADTLQKTVEEQRRQIEVLEKENNLMRVLIAEKSKQ